MAVMQQVNESLKAWSGEVVRQIARWYDDATFNALTRADQDAWKEDNKGKIDAILRTIKTYDPVTDLSTEVTVGIEEMTGYITIPDPLPVDVAVLVRQKDPDDVVYKVMQFADRDLGGQKNAECRHYTEHIQKHLNAAGFKAEERHSIVVGHAVVEAVIHNTTYYIDGYNNTAITEVKTK